MSQFPLLPTLDVFASIARNGAVQGVFITSLYVGNHRPISELWQKVFPRSPEEGAAARASKWALIMEYGLIALPLFYMGLHCRAKPVTMGDVFLLSIPKVIPIMYGVYAMICKGEDKDFKFYGAHLVSILTSLLCSKEKIVWKADVERLRALFQEAIKRPEFSLSDFVHSELYPLALTAKPMKWYNKSWRRPKTCVSRKIPEYERLFSLYNIGGDPSVSKNVEDLIIKIVDEFKKYFKSIETTNQKFSQRCEKAIEEYRAVKDYLLDSELSLKGIVMESGKYEAAGRVKDAAIRKAKEIFSKAIDTTDVLFQETLKQF